MTRILLALIAMIAFADVPSWCADAPAPAAKGEDFPPVAPPPGATSPAAEAGHGAAGGVRDTAAKSWISDLGSGAVVAGVAGIAVLEKMAPTLLMRFLPMAGPYGGILQLLLQGVLWLLKPKAQKDAEQLQSDHADAFQALASTIQTVSNTATVADLKQRLLTHLDPDVRATIDAFVAELKAQGINHDVVGSAPTAPATASAAKPAA